MSTASSLYTGAWNGFSNLKNYITNTVDNKQPESQQNQQQEVNDEELKDQEIKIEEPKKSVEAINKDF